MKYALLGLIFVALLIASRANATEQPSYTASQQSGPIEVRQYGSMVAAEVSVAGDRETASSAGFRALAGYIFGGNSGKRSIAMTAPVVQAQAQGQNQGQNQAKGQSIAMTAPVMQSGDGKEWTVRFIMPKAMTMQNLPTPNNPQVKLVPLKPASFAAIRFSGSARETDIQRQTKLLQDYMSARSLKATGPASLARYDPPWTPAMMRRNEIMIPIANP
jgi:hypothetical protein